MKFRALAIDIDGTITDMDRRLSLKAAEKLRTLDVPVILATGNVLCYARAASKLIGVCSRIIAENGGVITDGFDKEPIVSDHIHECEQAFDFLSQTLDMEKMDSSLRKTEIVLRRNFDIETARALLKTTGLGVEIIDTHFAIHIKSKKINKGTGLEKMADLMGLKVSDFIAIGDSVNDVEMLDMAGFAVAVGNADPVTKSVADYIAGTTFGDGTAEAIDYLISQGML